MIQAQYIVPPGFPASRTPIDPETTRLCYTLRGIDTTGVKIPNTDLWMQLKVMMDGATMEIKKRDKLVYINFYCLSALDAPGVMAVVQCMYDKYELGVARWPTADNWIHSVPVAHHLLQEDELILSQKVTLSFFWAVFAQRMNK